MRLQGKGNEQVIKKNLGDEQSETSTMESKVNSSSIKYDKRIKIQNKVTFFQLM